MVHVLVRILLLELGPLLIHVVRLVYSFWKQLTLPDITAPVGCGFTSDWLSGVLLLQYLLALQQMPRGSAFVNFCEL
jgi:hypothetical protein